MDTAWAISWHSLLPALRGSIECFKSHTMGVLDDRCFIVSRCSSHGIQSWRGTGCAQHGKRYLLLFSGCMMRQILRWSLREKASGSKELEVAFAGMLSVPLGF